VRDHSGGIGEAYTLSSSIDIAEQASASSTRAAAAFRNNHVPDSRKIDDDTTVTSAESCQAVAATSHGGANVSFRSGLNRDLHVIDVGAAEN
jgi:hypothetical protein